MKKLAKLFSKFWLPTLFIFLFLIVQAFSELALPSYTSDIINVGIQQGGIENAVPQQIRVSEMQKLLFFTDSAEDAEFVTGCYDISDDRYVLKSGITEEDNNRLDDIFGVPMMILYASSNMTEQSDISFDTTGMMNADGTMNIEFIKEQILQLDKSIINQVAVMYVKSEYTALGLDTDNIQTNFILDAGFYMLVFALMSMVASIVTTLLSSRVTAAFARDIRTSLFRKIMGFSNAEFDSLSTASIITRCTNDIQQIQMATGMILRMIAYAPIVGIGAFIKVVNQQSSIMWVIGVSVLAVLIAIGTLFVVALPKFKIVQKIVDNLNRISREILTGLPVIRAFSREEKEKKHFDTANVDITKLNLFLNRMMSVLMPTLMFIMNGVSVLIIWVGAGAVDTGSMQVGDLTAFISYTMQIIMAFLMLSMMSIMLPRAIISMKRVGEIFDTENSIIEAENPKSFDETKKGLLEFRNVHFRYLNADEDALSDISFVSKPGEITAIIGSTGCGKTTLANLIPRFFDVTAGEILIDDVDVRDVALSDLRGKLGFVSQKSVLFSGTIRSNIAYSDDKMPDEQVERAAEIAQATEFINEKEERYDDDISQGGSNVSGGQKQRLAIARAIAKNPEIYVFDDSFSALDYKTDIQLRKALSGVIAESTVILIAQRISTVMNAQQIIVLDEGRIAGKGTHAELMKNCEVYQQIALSQLSQEELDGKEGA